MQMEPSKIVHLSTMELQVLAGGRPVPRVAVHRSENAAPRDRNPRDQAPLAHAGADLKTHDVLNIGNDEGLLLSRQLVFHTMGYSVRSMLVRELIAPGRERARARVAVICHSIPEEACQECVNALRLHLPSIEIVRLAPWFEPDAPDACAESLDHSIRAIHSLSDPIHLLETVTRLIGPART